MDTRVINSAGYLTILWCRPRVLVAAGACSVKVVAGAGIAPGIKYGL